MPDDGRFVGDSGNRFIRRSDSEAPRGIVRAPTTAGERRPAAPLRPARLARLSTGETPPGAADAGPEPQKVLHAKAKAQASQGITDATEGSREAALYRSYRDQRIPLEIVCFDGIVIRGYLKAWERFNLMVQTPDGEMLIMKHGIIRILPRAFRPATAVAAEDGMPRDEGEDRSTDLPGTWGP